VTDPTTPDARRSLRRGSDAGLNALTASQIDKLESTPVAAECHTIAP
jgi:hypothetical protein